MLIDFLKAKRKEITDKTDNDLADKYINRLTETISDCVLATSQTYVETLKARGEFTKEAQQEAFKRTYENVMRILTDDCKEYLIEAFGDLETYITNRIEAEILANKKE